MNRSSFLILVSLICVTIILVVGISFWNVIMKSSTDMPLFDDVRERTDIIISDRIPIGCFIPPDSKADNIYNTVLGNASLRKSCLEIGKETYIEPSSWASSINNSLKYGIKLNGYCDDCDRKGCLCMKDDFPGWEEDGVFQLRRSLDFGTEYEPVRAIGKGLEQQNFTGIKGQPSVFVVMPGKEPKLSVYGGIKLRGKRTVEKVTAALYKGTVKEENRISEITGIERSCYWGGKWLRYQSCRNTGSKIDCRIKCDCYTDERYYDEDTLTICENYCNSKDFEGYPDAGKISNCETGCIKGEKRDCYKKCYAKTGNASECARAGVCNCPECISIEEYDLINNLCEGLSGDIKKGCENFTYFEKSTFQVNSSEYSNFKIGDLEWTGGSYRGPAWVVANITTKEPHPGASCYNPNHFNCYYNCWESVCEKAQEDSRLYLTQQLCNYGDGKSSDYSDLTSEEIWTLGQIARKKCEDSCNCSTKKMKESENVFINCRNFCVSRDGYYKDTEKVNSCVNGCEWASRQHTVKKDEEFEVGYNKSKDLTKPENIVPVNSSYIWREVYEEVFSNLVYIVDWKGDTSSWDSWSYPCGGNWREICTSEIGYNKSFELNPMLEEIKSLY